MNNTIDDSSTFGTDPNDWKCPICFTLAPKPVVACSNCGCHLLLLVKIRRVHDHYKAQNKSNAALAFYRNQSS